jgi:chitodextrinase
MSRASITALAAALALAAAAAPANAAQDTQAPSVPDGLHVISATLSTVTVGWNAARDNVGVAQYWALRSWGGSGQFFPTEQPRMTFTGLRPGKTYSVAVQASDAAGNYSTLSASIPAATARDTTAPSVPGGVRATSSLGHAAVTWSASSDDDRVDRYELALDGDTAHPRPAGDTVRNMAPNGTHTFAVRAVDASGNVSGWSAPFTLRMPDAADRTAPSPPTGFALNGNLVWNAASDDDAVLEYELYADGHEHAFAGTRTVFETFDANRCVDTLLPGTHTYTVRATDRSGNQSAPSNPVTVTR